MLLSILLVSLLSQCISSEDPTLTAPSDDSITQAANCTAVGTACDLTGSAVGNCSEKPGGGFLWTEVKQCDATESCNATSATCDETVLVRADYGVSCGTPGEFPDPNNCRQFYLCGDDLKPQLGKPCGSFLAYDACTKECDKILVNGVCPSVGTCPAPGVYVLQENQRVWYNCIVNGLGGYTVQWNLCPMGFFNVNTKACGFDASGGCKPTGPTVPTCTTPGIMADPDNCAAYYYCNTSLQAIHIDCTPGYHFSASQLGCILGSC